MIGRSDQYIQPPIYGDLTTNSGVELDAKKSPLALLAQTCSQIGADATTKVIVGSVPEKIVKRNESPLIKSPMSLLSPDDSSKVSSFKPYEKHSEDEDMENTPNKRLTPGSRSPHISKMESNRSHTDNSDNDCIPSSSHDLTVNHSSSSNSPFPHKNKPLNSPSHSLAPLGDLSNDFLSAFKLNQSKYPSLGVDSFRTAELSALTAKITSSSISPHHFSNFYIGYANVKTMGGNERVVPVCRDPYCTGCQINIHALQIINEACPADCVQCIQLKTHQKALSSLPSKLIPSIPASSLSGLYNASSLMSSNTLCNWMSGDTYCGKPFSSHEELLRHLRSHTGMSESMTPLSLSSLAHPLMQHAALPRGCPTPPLSPLSVARYHPYVKSPLCHLGQSAVSVPALATYYNPYSIYARSLSATAGMHP